MPEPTPTEKLQPCLLDRLTDDQPATTTESRADRVISSRQYREGVLRDLEWLFNASAHLPTENTSFAQLGLYPEVKRSVLNFGTRHLYGLLSPDMEELERELLEAVETFEPRIIRDTLSIEAILKGHVIAIEMRGDLWANPVPEQLFIRTKIDLETGQCLMGDAAYG